MGDPLYLTPYIQSGDVETGRLMAKVTDELLGVENTDQPESYSGFITVNPDKDSNMYFWFFPAQVNFMNLL